MFPTPDPSPEEASLLDFNLSSAADEPPPFSEAMLQLDDVLSTHIKHLSRDSVIVRFHRVLLQQHKNTDQNKGRQAYHLRRNSEQYEQAFQSGQARTRAERE
jgi:hypothetical protein